MAMMRWGAFNEMHPRSFVIIVDLEVRSQNGFELLNSLAESMTLSGNYALQPEPTLIRLAFERESDARTFAESVQAHPTSRESGRSGQWAFRLDVPTADSIRALLSTTNRKSSGTRSGTRLNRRVTPF